MAIAVGPTCVHNSIPSYCYEAFELLANIAYSMEAKGRIHSAIKEFEEIHNRVLLGWCHRLTNETVLYETRMTMKIIRMELSRLRQKLPKDPLDTDPGLC